MRMIFLLLTVLCVGHTLQAQTSLGIKAGLNSSTFDEYDFDYETNWRIGFHGGGLARVKLPRNFFLQTELLYSLKGSRIEWESFGDAGTVSLHYITLPIMAGFRTNEHISVMAGLEPGFKFTAYNHIEEKRIWVSKEYEKVDINAALGICYNLTDALGVDARYCHGLSKIHREDFWGRNGSYTERSRHNRLFQVGLFYLFSGR